MDNLYLNIKMYINILPAKMAELQNCSRCKTNQEITNFSVNKRGQLYKTCDTCREKKNNVIKVPEVIEEKEIEKYIMVMDVETNGLIERRDINPTKNNLSLFPRIVQFSWALYNKGGERQSIVDRIIKPDGWTMNGKDKYHGITLERAIEEGIDIKDVLTEFQTDFDKCDKLVCHNIYFDKNVVKSEFMRLGMDMKDVNEYCTMRNTMDLCRLEPMVRGNYKFPTLAQLHWKLFHETIERVHNSYHDVLNTAKCYFALNN